MSDANFILGFPVEFKKICLVYPPKVKDVASNENFGLFTKLLTFSQEEIEDEYVESNLDPKEALTPFEYLLNGAYNNQNFKNSVEEAFKFYIHEPIFLLPEQKQIIIGDVYQENAIQKIRFLKEEDFFDFQNLVRQSVGHPVLEPPNPNEDPRVKAIKAKARYRDRIKAKQGKGLNLRSMIASISCMQMGLNPLNIGELSYVAMSDLITIYQYKEKYQIDIDSLLAGADSKKVRPKYWIRNLEDLK